MMFEIPNLDQKLKARGRISLKIAIYPNFMKFGNLTKSKLLIRNMLTEIDDSVPKLYICKMWPQNVKCALIFMKFGN